MTFFAFAAKCVCGNAAWRPVGSAGRFLFAEQRREGRKADGIDATAQELATRFGLIPGLKRGHI